MKSRKGSDLRIGKSVKSQSGESEIFQSIMSAMAVAEKLVDHEMMMYQDDYNCANLITHGTRSCRCCNRDFDKEK